MAKKYKYFNLKEFDSPDLEGSGEMMEESFLDMLEEAREIAGIPFKINSGFRTMERNQMVGGRVGSSHLKGVAADIHCNNSHNRQIILNALAQAGFTRYGVAKTFIHVDSDKQKPDACWLY